MKRVLIVDDDAAILEILKKGLEFFGYAVDTAENEHNAKDIIGRSRPDVILMDISMPTTDGISFCRDLRVAPETSDLPIIMLTAFADDKTYHDAMLFGASGFITKPFEITLVRDKIEDAIKKAQSQKGIEK